LPEEFAADAERMARFEREAKVLASLNHPNIASIYGFEDSGGVHALVMELVEGQTLAERIASGPVATDEALPIAKQIAEGLEYAHERGIVHRDLKPANVKITPDGAVKLLDFGLAKALEGEAAAADISTSPTISRLATQAGIILGTAAYMSPEQAKGKVVDRRADIWAFGCVLFEMLAAKQTFNGETGSEILAAVIKEEPNWAALPSLIPQRIRELIRRCLQKDAKQRLQAIGDARIALEEAISGAKEEFLSAPPDAQQRGLAPGRHFLPWLLAASVALVVGVAVGWRVAARRSVAVPHWSAQMLGGPRTAMESRISPDGHTLAFQAMIDGLTQVAVMDTASGDWTLLTHDRSQGYVSNLSWSVDGSKIYFDRYFSVPHGIFSVSRFGGDERLILKDAKGPEVLPDGSMLVERINKQRNTQLYRFSPESGNLEALDALPAAEDLGSDVRAFHDGKDAVFFGKTLEQGNTYPSPHLYVINLASGKPHRLAPGLDLQQSSALPVFPLAVTADDRSVLVDKQAGNLHQIISIPSDGAGPIRALLTLTLPPLYIDTDKAGDLYLDQLDRPIEVLRFPASGGTPEVLAGSEGGASDQDIALQLPDGRVVFSAAVGKSRLLAAKPGSEATPLIEAKEETATPACRVGQGEIAFLLGPPNHRVVAIASVSDGRIVRRFSAIPAGEVTDLATSPDGKTLYYVASGTVWAIPVAGGEPRRVGLGDSVAPSPDGKYLIVKLKEKQGIRLMEVPVSGGAEKSIFTQGDLRLSQVNLSPRAVSKDGRVVVTVTALDSWFYGAAVVDLQAHTITRIPLNFSGDVESPGWLDDGRVISSGWPTKSTLWRFQPAASEGR
jgi:hypothetical protein